jgi:hypothetical protein
MNADEAATPEQHKAFIDGGIWRVACLSQIDFVVRALAPLPAGKTWS